MPPKFRGFHPTIIRPRPFQWVASTSRIVRKVRKYKDTSAAGDQSPVAKEALERIAQLYGIEKEIRGRSPDERKEIRRERSGPLLESMHAWLKATMAKLSRKSDVAVAIHYAFERWAGLRLFSDDDRIEMDNNAVICTRRAA
jgi:hypothetical protein